MPTPNVIYYDMFYIMRKWGHFINDANYCLECVRDGSDPYVS